MNESYLSLFQAHPWHGVSAWGGSPGVFNAFIEIVPADSVKYELDKSSGHLRLDRPQLFSSLCPSLYGFIPQTLCGPAVASRCAERTGEQRIEGDGDPMDICVLTEKVVTHGNLFVRARPIGGLRMIDGAQADDKIIAVLASDLAYGHIRDVAECPAGIIARIRHYFLNYKRSPDDQSRPVRLAELYDREEALETIASSQVDYERRFGFPGSQADLARPVPVTSR